jgi:hypothetical protein
MPDEKRLFYKVVSHRKFWDSDKDENKLYSSYIHQPELYDLITEYKVGEWVYPNVPHSLGLLVFGDLGQAELHMINMFSDHVYTCEVQRPIPYKNLIHINYSCNNSCIQQLVRNADSHMRMTQQVCSLATATLLSDWAPAPNGTFGCTTVKLLERKLSFPTTLPSFSMNYPK